MKQFNYNALDDQGREHSGFLEAVDHTLVLQQLKQRGLYVLQLREARVESDEKPADNDALSQIVALMPVTTSQKIFFFKQLALMLRSGISITEAFDIINKMQTGRMRQISRRISQRIKGGDSFSSAMEEHNSVFSRLATQMIRGAEASGELDAALMRIASYLERKAALRKQVLSAMMYPAFTLLAAIGVLIFLLVYIIPKFQALLERAGRQVPPTTQFMIDLGEFFTSYWPLLLVASLAGIVSFIVLYRRPGSGLVIDRLILSVPLIGATIVSAAMAQLSWGLGMLLKSGIPVVDSLRIIAGMINNRVIAGSISVAAEKVVHGQDLGTSFRQPFITALIHQLMIVGERSGNLVTIMDEASAYYEDDLQTKTRRLANMVEPMAILLIGGIVGFVYFGFFQALMSVTARG